MSTFVTDSAKHKKLSAMIALILAVDTLLMSWAVYYFADAGVGPLLLLLFECWILFTELVQTSLTYGSFLLDLTYQISWPGRNEFCYYVGTWSYYYCNIVDFALETVRLVSTIGHFLHIWKTNGFGLTVIDMLILALVYRTANEVKQKTVSFLYYLQLSATIENS